MHTLVKHDVLGVVLAEENGRVSLNSRWGLQFQLSAIGKSRHRLIPSLDHTPPNHGGHDRLPLTVPVVSRSDAALSHTRWNCIRYGLSIFLKWQANKDVAITVHPCDTLLHRGKA